MSDVAVSLSNLRRFRNKLINEDIPPERIWRGNGTPPTGTEHIIAVNYADGLLYFKNELGGWTVMTGGGGGGSNNNAEFTVTNTSGWLSKTVALGASCWVSFTWSSIEDELSTGNGMVKIAVGGSHKSTLEVEQGNISINLSQYLLLGSNEVEITISDLYGNSKTYKFSITTVQVSISSYFDPTMAYTGDINFTYIPVGAVEKTVYFLIDGEEIGRQTVTASNREQPFTIPAQSHGSHIFEVYFTCEIDGHPVETDHLVYDLICYEEGNAAPIIASAFSVESVKQFATVPIKWIAYTPELLTTEVTIYDNFGFITTRTVDRTEQTLSYKAENVGATDIYFAVGGEIKKHISFPVHENKIDVSAETANLELYLNAKGRSNNDTEKSPSEWEYGNIKADLRKFNFISDGWQLDDNGDTVLRVSGNARVYIPFNIFETDFKNSGKTIEFEFATRDVLNPNETVISCWSGNRGVKITAQEAILKSEQNEVSRQYKEDEHIRVTFTVQKAKQNHLISLYINGNEAKSVQYVIGDGADNFSQSEPVGISIGSNLCTTDIYCIRVYNAALDRYAVIDNWIADTQDIEELIDRYNRNDVFDGYGNIDVEKIHNKGTPYFVVYVDNYSDLPQKKRQDGEPKIYVDGKYVDPLHPERSFTFYGAEIDVQGTSSEHYPRKNYKIKFKNGFTINGVAHSKYQLRETSMPTDVFTFKADYASSEGANNVELAMLYDEVNPERTPPQLVDKRVRQGIEGYPCVMFYYDGTNHHFIGKYNFNNDKATEEVFGFAEGDESWEILNNNTDRGSWKDDDYSDGKWKDTFKARYPEDNTDVSKLQRFATWIKSTDTTAVDSEEEKQARITKFRNEASDYMNVRAMCFNYVFTETFLMVDNRKKNAFPTFYLADEKHLIILPYDFDTALGINNNGELKFGYWLEDIDTVDGSDVFNGQDSVLYVNMRLAFFDEIKAMYQEIRGHKAFNYKAIIKRFKEHQKVWGEAISNEDSRFKYTDPLIEQAINNLAMLQGLKQSQLEWWLYNRLRYLDSKYNTGDSATDKISFYAYVKEDIEVTPYADIYASAHYDSEYAAIRALRGDSETPRTYTIKNPTYTVKGEPAKDQVIAIYSASQLASIGDLSKFKIGYANFSAGTKLNTLKIGNSIKDENGVELYDNEHLTSLTVGNLNLLTSLDVRNCSALEQPVDVSGCKNIKTVLCEGTKTTAVILPNGGVLETLHLPETVKNLTIRNQPSLSEFTIENNNFSNIETLRLEGVDYGLFNFVEILNEIKPNSLVRLLGIEMSIETAEEIFVLYDKFDTFRGLDENGNPIGKAVIGGTIYCGTITSNDYTEMVRRYPNINIVYEHITSNVYFYVDGELVHTAIVYDGGDCYDAVEVIGTPEKAEDETSKYIYNSWDNDLKSITADTTVHAVFDEYKKYFVTFKDDKGNVVQVNGKDTNVYYDRHGENVVALPADLPDYSEEIDGATYDHYFKGWRNAETLVEGVPIIGGEDYSLTYEAVFSSFRVYVVKFIDNDGSEWNRLHLYEGEAITVPVNPSKASDAQYDYPFKGWSTQGTNLNNENVEAVASVVGTADITYYAVYDSELRYYYVTFLDWDGTEKSRKLLGYGSPVTIPTDPIRTGYTFREWLPAVDTTVRGEATYKAEYDINYYAIRFLDWDNTVISERNVMYNIMPVIPADPTRESTAQYDYTFVGWDKGEVANATQNVDYTAVYSSKVRSYTITWKVGGLKPVETTVAYGIKPTPPYAEGYEFTDGDIRYTVENYSPAIVKVTGNAVYTAILSERAVKTAYLSAVDSSNATGTSMFNGGEYVSRAFDPSFIQSDEETLPDFIFDVGKTKTPSNAEIESIVLYLDGCLSKSLSVAEIRVSIGTLNANNISNGAFSGISNRVSRKSYTAKLNKTTSYTNFAIELTDAITASQLNSSALFVSMTLWTGSDIGSTTASFKIKNVKAVIKYKVQ